MQYTKDYKGPLCSGKGPTTSAFFDVLHAVLAMACHIGLVKHQQSHAADGIFFEKLLALVKRIAKATSTMEVPSKPGDGHTMGVQQKYLQEPGAGWVACVTSPPEQRIMRPLPCNLKIEHLKRATSKRLHEPGTYMTSFLLKAIHLPNSRI